MTDWGPSTRYFEFETFGVAVGLALVCGALSVFFSVLDAPTATLAALALAGWLSLARRTGALHRDRFDRRNVAALVGLGATSAVYLSPPTVLVPVRGLLLAMSLVPLFLLQRSATSYPPPVFSSA